MSTSTCVEPLFRDDEVTAVNVVEPPVDVMLDAVESGAVGPASAGVPEESANVLPLVTTLAVPAAPPASVEARVKKSGLAASVPAAPTVIVHVVSTCPLNGTEPVSPVFAALTCSGAKTIT